MTGRNALSGVQGCRTVQIPTGISELKGKSALGHSATCVRHSGMSVLEAIPEIDSATNENKPSKVGFATGLQICLCSGLCEKRPKVVGQPKS